MKEGMMHNGQPTLSAYQVATIRMLSAGLALLPFTLKSFRTVSKEKIWLMVLSGLLGSFFPAYLFCIAETHIDSSLAGALNALTPIFTIIIGVFFFGNTVGSKKIIGVAIAFSGSILLLLAKQKHISDMDGKFILFALLVVLATILYGFNVNVVSKKLREVGSLNIAAIAFTSLMIPSVIVLFITGFHQLPLHRPAYLWSVAASSTLGIMGTAVASILFYVLVKRAGGLFASTVTYGIPFIALGWGMLAGEFITLQQVACLAVILAGVYITNRS
jgi:drug/metabolite transporter (DMT)-like permease